MGFGYLKTKRLDAINGENFLELLVMELQKSDILEKLYLANAVPGNTGKFPLIPKLYLIVQPGM